jgi:hypothetical protein
LAKQGLGIPSHSKSLDFHGAILLLMQLRKDFACGRSQGNTHHGVPTTYGIYFVKYRIQIAGGMTYEDTPRIYLFK